MLTNAVGFAATSRLLHPNPRSSVPHDPSPALSHETNELTVQDSLTLQILQVLVHGLWDCTGKIVGLMPSPLKSLSLDML